MGADLSKLLVKTETFEESYQRILMEASPENITDVKDNDVEPKDAEKSEKKEPDVEVDGQKDHPEGEAPESKNSGEEPDPSEEGKAATEALRAILESEPVSEPAAEEPKESSVTEEVVKDTAADAATDAVMEDGTGEEKSEEPKEEGSNEEEDKASDEVSEVEDATEEVAADADDTEEVAELYARVSYMLDCVLEDGVSQPLVAGLNYENAVYTLVPQLPSLEALPPVGDVSSDETKIAVEALGDVLAKFWEWLKGTCANIVKLMSGLMGKVMNMVSNVSGQIKTLSDKLVNANVDKKALASKEVELIPYNSHFQVLKALPSLTAEVVQGAKAVQISDWKGKTLKALKGAGIALYGTGGVGNVVGGTLMNKNASGVSEVFGVDKRVATAASQGIAAGGAVSIGISAILAAKMLKSWVAFGCQVRTDGLVDMSKFNNNQIFQAKKGSVDKLGWNQKVATDHRQITNALDLTKQADNAAKTIIADMKQLEKDVISVIPKGKAINPKAVQVARKLAQSKINGATSIQKLTASMIQASLKLAKNFLAAQRAVLSCSDNA